MANKIIEIDRKDFFKLRDLYLKDWPNNMIGYYTIDNFISWFEQDPSIKNVNFYSLNCDWSDGTFVAIHRYQLFANTISSSCERLFELLKLIDWSRITLVSALREKHCEVVLETIEVKRVEKVSDNPSLVFYMPREEAANLEVNIPDGVTLEPLKESHCEIVDNVWPHQHNGSLYLLKIMRRLNPNVGVFTKDGKLIAWSFRLAAGALGTLQVDDKYQGQGYGTLVCRAITKKLGEAGQDVFACVFERNTASRKMFARVGFTEVDIVHWIATKPTVSFEWRKEFE